MKVLYVQVLLLSIVVTLGANIPDEDHPYEFGFTVDGQQHRHEKKDDKGIIQGEFGFITADGIYHVTVYATDENGDFKILSMRNLRISAPLDGSPFKGEISPEANKYRKQANLAPLPAPNALSLPEDIIKSTSTVGPEVSSTIKTVEKFTTQSTIRPACASCGLITTPKPQTLQPFVYQNINSNLEDQTPGTITIGKNPNLQEGQQPEAIGSGHFNQAAGESSSGNLPPAYQAVSRPQNTNYNKYGSQEQDVVSSGQIPNTGSSLIPFRPANEKNTNSGSNPYSSGSQFNNEGAGYSQQDSSQTSADDDQPGQSPNTESLDLSREPNNHSQTSPDAVPKTQIGNTDGQKPPGQYSNVEGQPYNRDNKFSNLELSHTQQIGGQSGQSPITEISQRPYELSNNAPVGQVDVSNTQIGNTGNLGSNAFSPGPQVNHLGLNDRGQQPQIGQAGNDASFGVQSGPVVGSTFQQPEIPEPNPLRLSEDRGANALSTLPPISVSDGIIHVGGERKQDIPIKDKFSGMQDGLPAGIEEKDITNLLYKFHYTVGFHGHYEKGLKNGAKIGGYFVNGRDGISRVVTYIADENGYRPKVKFINLGLESDDTPKPETEKTFGLKSFEFVWYPL